MKMIEVKFLKMPAIFVGLLAFTFACNEEVGQPIEELEFTSVAIPSNLKADVSSSRISTDLVVEEVEVEITTENGEKVKGVVRVTMPAGDAETLVKFEVTSNILDATDADADFWINSVSSNGRVEGIGSCLKACSGNDDLSGSGRKWCKGGCWAELVLKVVAVVILL